MKKYLYKVYDGDNYVGILKNVTSEFTYSQDINSNGSQLAIEIAADQSETNPLSVRNNLLITEDGDFIVTENGDRIVLSREYVINSMAIDVGNRIEAICYYDNQVNGITVFDGMVTARRVDYGTNKLSLKVMSWGFDLANYIIDVPAGGYVVNYDYYTSTQTVKGNLVSTNVTKITQTFETDSIVTSEEIEIYSRKKVGYGSDVVAAMYIYEKDGTAWNEIGRYKGTLTSDTLGWNSFRYDTAYSTYDQVLTYSPTTTYKIEMFLYAPASATDEFDVGYDSSGGYPNGRMTRYSQSISEIDMNSSLNFRIVSYGDEIGRSFYSSDPADIARSLLDTYATEGGMVTYDNTSLESTGLRETYTFKLDTVLEGITKCKELAPPNWYYYIDVGTRKLHLHENSQAADHTFMLGVHIHEFNIEDNLEGLKNYCFFSGAEIATGENLLISNRIQSSEDEYGRWLDIITDNRVSRTDTANTLSQNALNQSAAPKKQTTITILDTDYDIETIYLGDMVGFGNVDDIVDNTVLQIAGMTRRPNAVTLRLDKLPPVTSTRVEDIKRGLDKAYTANSNTITI